MQLFYKDFRSITSLVKLAIVWYNIYIGKPRSQDRGDIIFVEPFEIATACKASLAMTSFFVFVRRCVLRTPAGGSEGSTASGRISDLSEWQRSIKSRISVSPKILSGTATEIQESPYGFCGRLIGASFYFYIVGLMRKSIPDLDGSSQLVPVPT